MYKKILASLALMSCLVPPLGRANDIEPGKEFYTAPKAKNPIVIDGDLSEWGGVAILADPKFAVPKGTGGQPNANYVLFEEYNGGTWSGPADQTSAVQIVYDADNVYFGFVVTDDYHENSANSAWDGDAVQLMIADKNRASQIALYNYALGGVEDALGDTIIMTEAGPGGTEAVVTRDGVNKKTYYEIKLPAASLGLTAPLTAGTSFGLGMAINDGDDGPGQNGQKGWGGLGAHALVFGKSPGETALVTLGSTDGGAAIGFLSGQAGTIDSFSFNANDNGTSIINQTNASLTIDGQVVSLVHTNSGAVTTFTYTPAAPFPAGSKHTYSILVRDTSNAVITSTGTFTTPTYALLTDADKVTADTSKPGFFVRVHQNNAFTATDNVRPVLQLAGLLGGNLADPAAQGPAIAPGVSEASTNLPIDFEIETVINLDQAAGNSGEFTPDDQIPGIPGLGAAGQTDGIVAEITTYLDLTAGRHTLIVNSDDGFRTTAGNINDIFRAQVAGQFVGGRGFADTPYDVVVQTAGVYPFRTIWYEGGGGANVEWKEVKADGTHVLINDVANGGTAAYRKASGGANNTATAITLVIPLPSAGGVAPDSAVGATIAEGTNAVDLSSVKLSLNGTNLTAPATKSGNIITVNFKPTSLFPSASSNYVTLTYTAGGVARTENWFFNVTTFALLTSDQRVTPDTSKPGFHWRTHQNNGFTANDVVRPVQQLAGFLGVNYADTNAQGVAIDLGTPEANNRMAIDFDIETVINMDRAAGSNGEFTPDDQMPGYPGLDPAGSATDGAAGEITTYLDLPAGITTLIVNSDDDFITTGGNISDLFIPTVLGSFAATGGRGAADTAYSFYVQQAGVYPIRTVWENGGGGSNIEWKSVKADGTHVLVNDVANGGIKAYRVATGGPTAITSVTPAVGQTGVVADSPVMVQIAEGTTAVDLSSVKLTLNGAPVGGPATKSGNIITVNYQPPALLPPGSSNNVSITFTAGGVLRTTNWFFNVPIYGHLTADLKVTTADTTKPGFHWRVHQNDAFQATDNVRPAQQLAGLLGENFADPAAQGIAIAPGTSESSTNLPIDFDIETVINMDRAAGSFGEFTPDDQMPGIPGLSAANPTFGIAGEITTYLELPAGKSTLIVNSDDGFRTTAGNINDLLDAQQLGQFVGGRGASDTEYSVFVDQAGVYPVKTVWYQGGGGANIEWKYVKADGTHVLINDVANGGPKAYRALTAPVVGAFVTAVSPGQGAGKVLLTSGLQVTVLEQGTPQIANAQLKLDGNSVTTTVTHNGNIATISGQPASAMSAGLHTATITFSVGGVSRSSDWTFTVPITVLDKIHQYPGLLLGSTKGSANGGGHTGATGDYAVDFGLAGSDTAVEILDGTFLNATAADDQMTFSIWVKKYQNNNSSAFWADSPSSNNSERGYQAHIPWDDSGAVYFDSAGCCGTDTRINANVNATTIPSFTGEDWWTNEWHHFAFVKNAGRKEIWVDGTLLVSGDAAGPLPTDFTRIWVGAIGGGDVSPTSNFRGLIDDFAIYGTGLSQADVTKLATGTSPTALDAATKPLAFWDFNDIAGGGVVTPPTGPTLTGVRNTAGALVLSWSATDGAGFRLQSVDTLGGVWADVTGVTGNTFTVTPLSGAAKFYRLIK